ncbi:MAG: ubiquinone biosynthesis regulatory protein kinase UbiB [Gammaproteobacteria bacterium]|nr:ubiquinone biosynthesis regulatory protein kinase UbiB [Gammaproteobacteria bacterium]MBU1656239.1 ubiquinone biosynthesis regulatory protein kinase UbiB [Gammaproteobacteria bacterium]MBU1959804.1 ubiquinone biosynthesis regulatory protein kinase UbiB [Gammaproteobacteria bacterium]
MRSLFQAWRLLHIAWVLLRNGLDEVLLATHLFRSLRFLTVFAPWYWLPRNKEPFGVRIRQSLEQLGPIFVKFGQAVSTRRDLLPEDIADELAKLQDRVPPFPAKDAIAVIERAFGRPLRDIFASFSEEPLASASIAQVHVVRLQDNREAVVKVLRPGVDRIIRRDVDLLFTLARFGERFWSEGKRLRLIEVVQEYEKTIFDELDLLREAANAALVRRNFQNSKQLYVPEIYWDYCRTPVMVMERVFGTPVCDTAALRAQNVDMKLLGERGVEIFFTQVFRDNFFHADMHPGNIFVSPEGQYIAVDFGIIGSLTKDDQRYLAENLLAFFNRDYKRVAELHVESGWVPKETRIDEFEAAIRTVSEPIFEKPISEISFGHFLLRLFQTARRFNMEVQPQLVLLQKTLLNVEGLGRQLYPQLDLWTTAKPFLERWADEQVGFRAFLRRTRQNLPLLSETLPDLPIKANKLLEDALQGRLTIQWQSEELQRLHESLQIHNRRVIQAIGGGSMLIAGALLLTLTPAILSVSAAFAFGGALGFSGLILLANSGRS